MLKIRIRSIVTFITFVVRTGGNVVKITTIFIDFSYDFGCFKVLFLLVAFLLKFLFLI